MTYWIVLAAVVLLAIFLPRYGLFKRYADWRGARQREQVEDALKHLLDREQQGRHASPESLAGCLDLRRARTTALIAAMESQGLVESRGAELHLTADGERWALHVVRAHRLWERYLADEARMPLARVHTEAHRREHRLTDAQLDALDAALGHPVTDPHGDPIPTREGNLPRAEGMPITGWQADRPAKIVHLEDEPALAYQQILAAGLRLGQTVRILESSPQRYVLSDGENEYRLAPAVAANVHVAPLPEGALAPSGAIPLDELPHDRRAQIVTLDEAVQGFTRRRFLDLGLTPGAEIYPELKNFFGDPRGYRLRGTLIALRREQAAQIWVKPVEG
ncbi:MAG: metal-dependent transcriptional regulator [Chloroflexota bacterium]